MDVEPIALKPVILKEFHHLSCSTSNRELRFYAMLRMKRNPVDRRSVVIFLLMLGVYDKTMACWFRCDGGGPLGENHVKSCDCKEWPNRNTMKRERPLKEGINGPNNRDFQDKLVENGKSFLSQEL